MKKILLVLMLSLLVFSPTGFSQESSTNELQYEVNRVYPYIAITKETLQEAQTLADLNWHYKPSWVREYLSVEVITIHNGKLKKVVGKSGRLSPEQKEAMKLADAGKDILVKIRYIPENNLRQNDAREMNFTFTVDPVNGASYIGGNQQLKQYLKENVIDEIPAGTFEGYALAAVKFTINEDGEIINAHIFESSRDETVDAIMLETIQKMPCWKPAAYADGTKVKQEFSFAVGNMESCVTNLLSTKRDRPSKDNG